MRRAVARLAGAIPRSAWDPAHHDPRWVDSYAKPMADRRSWPAKTFSIVEEPTTPTEYLQYSKRNMAYAYNAAMRACATFPDMLEYYAEMKARGVLVDLDTAFVLVSRGARYERMSPIHLFELYDELVQLGARCDITVIEVLHTVWEHSVACPAEWREAKRRQLVDIYHSLVLEDIATYGGKGFDALMLQQVERYTRSLDALGACLRPAVWAAVFAYINNGRDLLSEVAHMMRCRAGKNAETQVISIGRETYSVPDLSKVMRRQHDSEDAAQRWGRSGLLPLPEGETFGPQHFEDVAFNEALAAAVGRIVDGGFPDTFFLAQQLLVILHESRLLLTHSLLAEFLDIVRFTDVSSSPDMKVRKDKAARAALRRALRAGNVDGQDAAVAAWKAAHQNMDARVVARYLMAVDPWADRRFDLSSAAAPAATSEGSGDAAAKPRTKVDFQPFTTLQSSAQAASAAASGTTSAEDQAAVGAATDAADADAAAASPRGRRSSRTTDEVRERVKNVRAVIIKYAPKSADAASLKAGGAKAATTAAAAEGSEQQSGNSGGGDFQTKLNACYRAPNGMQLITAQFVFLRQLAAAEGQANPYVCHAVVRELENLKREMDELLSSLDNSTDAASSELQQHEEETPLAEGPETEAWESLLATLRLVMDATVSVGGEVTREQRDEARRAFEAASKLRDQVVKESLTRFNGKFKMLWLEEA